VATKIEEAKPKGSTRLWLEKDREQSPLAISALDYLEQVQQYEASQQGSTHGPSQNFWEGQILTSIAVPRVMDAGP